MPILGEGARWRRDDEHGVLFNMRNRDVGASFDTACGLAIVPIPAASDVGYHMTRFEPYASSYRHPTHGNVSIVHHMDVFACDERLTRMPSDEACMSNPWLGDDGPCYSLLWAYDKGALTPHRLPPDAGFRVGKDTRYRTLLLQVHALLPRASTRPSPHT